MMGFPSLSKPVRTSKFDKCGITFPKSSSSPIFPFSTSCMTLTVVKSLVMDAIQQTESASKSGDSDSRLSFPKALEYSVLPVVIDVQRMTQTWANCESGHQGHHTIFVFDMNATAWRACASVPGSTYLLRISSS